MLAHVISFQSSSVYYIYDRAHYKFNSLMRQLVCVARIFMAQVSDTQDKKLHSSAYISFV